MLKLCSNIIIETHTCVTNDFILFPRMALEIEVVFLLSPRTAGYVKQHHVKVVRNKILTQAVFKIKLETNSFDRTPFSPRIPKTYDACSWQESTLFLRLQLNCLIILPL